LSDGARLWQTTPAPQTNIISPLLVRGSALIYISVSTGGYNANALNLTTHTLTWTVPLHNYTQDLQYPAFVANADNLFVGSGDGVVSALRLSDGKLAWTHQTSTPTDYPYPPSIWVALGTDLVYAYGANGHIFALRQTDGALVWREPAGLKPDGQETLTATATSLYACGSLPGDAGPALASLDPATGAIRWQRAATCRYNSLVEANGVLYLSGATLNAMRASDGAKLWSATTQTADLGFTSVQVDHGVVFAAATVIYPHNVMVCADWWSGGALFCHSQPFIVAFDGATGAHYWQAASSGYTRLLGGTSLQ
jgi:outer membrane protein assembly factor BamB